MLQKELIKNSLEKKLKKKSMRFYGYKLKDTC